MSEELKSSSSVESKVIINRDEGLFTWAIYFQDLVTEVDFNDDDSILVSPASKEDVVEILQFDSSLESLTKIVNNIYSTFEVHGLTPELLSSFIDNCVSSLFEYSSFLPSNKALIYSRFATSLMAVIFDV